MTTGQPAHAERLREHARRLPYLDSKDEHPLRLACAAGAAALDEVATLRAERDTRAQCLVEAEEEVVRLKHYANGLNNRLYALECERDTLAAQIWDEAAQRIDDISGALSPGDITEEFRRRARALQPTPPETPDVQ